MSDKPTIKRLTKARRATPNVLDPDLAGWRDGEKGLMAAGPDVRAIVQNVIDGMDDHAHLREAKLLILGRLGAKPNADSLVELGKARKASGMMKAIHTRPERPEPDFVITLNGDVWSDLEPYQGIALIDHELTHCAATIAGRFVPEAKLTAFVEQLGKDHVETMDQVRDDKGRVMVRYRKRRGGVKAGEEGYHDQPYAWRMRKHDVEEFVGVFARWGAWSEMTRRLVDVIEPAEDEAPLLDAAK